MSACSRCGALFSCAMDDAAGQACWCADLPRLPRSALLSDPQADPPSCLCPSCLKTRIAETAQESEPAAKPR